MQRRADDAVLGPVRRPDRAHGRARRLLALHAQAGLEVRLRNRLARGPRGRRFGREAGDAAFGRVHVARAACRDRMALDPGASEEVLLGDVVLLLARDDAQAAADARGRVDHEGPRLAGRVVGRDDRSDCAPRLLEDREQARQTECAAEAAEDRQAEAEEAATGHGDGCDGGSDLGLRHEPGGMRGRIDDCRIDDRGRRQGDGDVRPAALTLAAPPSAACGRGRAVLVRDVVQWGHRTSSGPRPGPWQSRHRSSSATSGCR